MQVVQQTGVSSLRFVNREGRYYAEILSGERDLVMKASVVMGVHIEHQSQFVELERKEHRLREQERRFLEEKLQGASMCVCLCMRARLF